MKHVRIWFSKTGTAKYISHLDLNRCMHRAVQKAGIPLWYTEGFHPHAFLTFALPLSLGTEGLRESMDIKLEGELSTEETIGRLNTSLPEGIRVFAITEPLMKPGKIAYASFQAYAESEGESVQALLESVQNLLARPEIVVEKRTKSGIKEMDLKGFLDRVTLSAEDGFLKLDMTLPAGSTENVNPSLFFDALKKYEATEPFVRLERTGLYDAEMQPFA